MSRRVRSSGKWMVLVGLVAGLALVVGGGAASLGYSPCDCWDCWNVDGVTFLVKDHNVGIGTTSPERKLEVVAPGVDVIRAILQGKNSGVVLGAHIASPEDGRIYGYREGNLPSGEGAADRARLFINSYGRDTIMNDHYGNVGIGTADPQSKLAVWGLPVGPPAGETLIGMLCITTNGNIFIDRDPSTPCLPPY